MEASLDSVWVADPVLERAAAAAVHGRVDSASATLLARFAAEVAADAAVSSSRDERALARYVNGFWRWPWRRELHIWEVRTNCEFRCTVNILLIAQLYRTYKDAARRCKKPEVPALLLSKYNEWL